MSPGLFRTDELIMDLNFTIKRERESSSNSIISIARFSIYDELNCLELNNLTIFLVFS